MSQSTNLLSDETIIEVGKSVPLGEYRKYFDKAGLDKAFLSSSNFYKWLNSHSGKMLKEAVELYFAPVEIKNMSEILTEKRFDIVSKANKNFIISFDKEIQKLGFNFGGTIGKGNLGSDYMISFSKTNTKTKKVVARIFIWNDKIVLKLIFNHVDKHRDYIEKAPEHIKEIFVDSRGNCVCDPKKENCRMLKTYFIDGKRVEKCSEKIFEICEPDEQYLVDYISLVKTFYGGKYLTR